MKTYYPGKDEILLHPENPAFEDIHVSYQDLYLGEAQIIGKMITCIHGEDLKDTGEYLYLLEQ